MGVSQRCLQRRLALIVLLSLPLCALVLVYGQADERSVFDPVPRPLRGRLAERLDLLVKLERDHKWSEQYALLSQIAIQDETRESYIIRRQKNRSYAVLGFTAKYTALMYEGRWEIFGCVKVREKGKTQELNGEVAAFLEEGEWRFSQVFFDQKRCTR